MKLLPVLTLLLLLALSSGCTEEQTNITLAPTPTSAPTPDIGATVDAAVRAALATTSQPTNHPDKATVEARLQSTGAALPIPTVPPTPTPTPVPTFTSEPTIAPRAFQSVMVNSDRFVTLRIPPTPTPVPTPTVTPTPPVTPEALENWTSEQARGVLNITNQAQHGLYGTAEFEWLRPALRSIFPEAGNADLQIIYNNAVLPDIQPGYSRLNPEGYSDDTIYRRAAHNVFSESSLRGSAMMAIERRYRVFDEQRAVIYALTPPEQIPSLQKAFEAYLRSPEPTGNDLGQKLAKLVNAAATQGPGSEPALRLYTTDFFNPVAYYPYERIRPAFLAAIQPTYAGLAPRNRDGFANVAENSFLNSFASDPGSFATAYDVLRSFQSSGYFEEIR